MRGGKHAQQIYKPGGGNLRRSNQGADDLQSDSNSTGSLNAATSSKGDLRYKLDDLRSKSETNTEDLLNRKNPRSSKKPERALYVPRVVAQARESVSPNNNMQEANIPNGNDRSNPDRAPNRNNLNNDYARGPQGPNRISNSNQNSDYDKGGGSKRYSNRNDRGGYSRNDNSSEWRDKSPSGYRNIRMGSEPRGNNSQQSTWFRDRHRERDTKSVELTGPNPRNNNHHDKLPQQTKPPSGRRHSTIGNNFEQDRDSRMKLKNLENMPPRFRRKYLEEQGLSVDEQNWDGSSSAYTPSYKSSHPQNIGYGSLDYYGTLPPQIHQDFNTTPNHHYHTLPSRPVSRGRGRIQLDGELQQGLRSMTPEPGRSPANSRPPTPTRRYDNIRPHTPTAHYSDSRNYQPDSSRHDNRAPSVDNRQPIDSLLSDNRHQIDKPISDNRHQNDRPVSDNRHQNDRPLRSGVNERLEHIKRSEPRHSQSSRGEQNFNHRERKNDDNNWRRNDINPDRRDDGDRNRSRNTSDKDRNVPKDRHDRDKNSQPRDRKRDKDRQRRRTRDGSNRDFQRRDSNVSQISQVSYREENRGTEQKNEYGNERGRQKEAVENGNVTPTIKGGFRPSLEVQLSPVSAGEISDGVDSMTEKIGDVQILDWNAEVELNDKLEAEAFSDAMTRSSSLTSLQDISTRSMPASSSNTPNSKKSRRKSSRRSKNRSHSRGSSTYRDRSNTSNPDRRNRLDSTTSIESNRDYSFKAPLDPVRGRRNDRQRSRDSREPSFDRFRLNRSRRSSRDVSWERGQSTGVVENWREEIVRSRQNSEREGSVVISRRSSERSRNNSSTAEDVPIDTKKAGVLVLPSKTPEVPEHQPFGAAERPKFPDIKKTPPQQKTLFDPSNPNKPIVVKSPGSRVAVPGFSDIAEKSPPQMYTTDMFGNLRPNWYDESREEFLTCHYQELLRDIKRADNELQHIINRGMLLVNYETVDNLRQFLKSALEFLLLKTLKFCQTENVEQHLWKLLYYNIIEVTRKAIVNDPANKEQYKGFLLYLIDEGTKYFEKLIALLEENYKFKVKDFIGNNSVVSHKGLGFVGLALVCVQKIFLFLGDLGRYREQVNETSNYGKCRQWYIKSHEINPKNGKPYNQLAVLAVYSKRKLDAVYYYMRSLMSSNPVPSARESLISLFDENRKKYEQGEKKRREERLERQRNNMKQKESEENTPNFLRKETWIHPEGGKRLHRTTKALQDQVQDSEEEDLASLSSVDVNKRFVISYLHVHGKLITKIGLEGFQDAAMQMLKEFRALLQHSPVPLPCNRFLQLLALNMFAIESTQLKDQSIQQSTKEVYRSELQERALIISLQMFNLILERCVSILHEHMNLYERQGSKGSLLDSLPHDANVLLPAIKIWCDWMLCHTSVWNPPPSTQDFKIGHTGDLWSRLGLLMNFLEKMDPYGSDIFSNESRDEYDHVRLPEDATLCGFTPLMFNEKDTAFAPVTLDPEIAQLRLRVSQLLFFGTVYLCGLEPPVLKLEIEDERRDYVSVVRSDRGRESSPSSEGAMTPNDEVLLETFSGDEEDTEEAKTAETSSAVSEASSEVRDLLTRKVELEKRKKLQEIHRQRVMKILSQSVVSVHVEVRPKYLVPDTNCFIDHLDSIQLVSQSHCYTFMVPIIVLSELEGLSKGGTPTTKMPASRLTLDPDHVRRVGQSARSALEFLKRRHATVKCVTTRGTVLASTAFSAEDDTSADGVMTNDDKILTTCVALCKGHHHVKDEKVQEAAEDEPRHIVREVVLLTEDRNLRVKAYARDVPVRELPDFMRWAGLG